MRPGELPDPSATRRVSLTADVGAARRFVADALQRIGREDALDEATLCTSELVTNALRHGGGSCELAVTERDGAVQIEVHDTSPVFDGRTPDALQESGRGLDIVGTVADRWGVVVQRGDGKSIWCQVGTGRPASARRIRRAGGRP